MMFIRIFVSSNEAKTKKSKIMSLLKSVKKRNEVAIVRIKKLIEEMPERKEELQQTIWILEESTALINHAQEQIEQHCHQLNTL